MPLPRLPTVSRFALVALVVLAGSALPAAAPAQNVLRTTHAVGRTAPTHVEVTGTVSNEARSEAVDVSVTVEALGTNGKPVARGVTHVAPRLPAGASVNYTAKVPAVSGIASYRATASGKFLQTPGESP